MQHAGNSSLLLPFTPTLNNGNATSSSFVTNCANQQSAMDSSLCPLSAAVMPITDKILLPLVATVGIVGNILNLLTLTQKEMRSGSSKTLQLLIIMSSNDLALLLLQIPQFLTHFSVSVKTFYSFYFVYVRYPLSNILLTCNVWLTVGITIERCVAFTKHKHASSKRFSKQSLHRVLAQALQSGKHIGFALLALSAALNLPKFFDLHVAKVVTVVANATNQTEAHSVVTWQHQSTAFGANPTYQKVAFWGAAMMVTVVPLVILVVLTGVLVYRIDQHRKRKQRLNSWRAYAKREVATSTFQYDLHTSKLESSQSAPMAVESHGTTELPSTPESPLPPQLAAYVSESPRTPLCYVPNTITILVVCIVVVFILTDWLAVYLTSLIAVFGRDEVMRLDTTQALRHISNLLVVTNSSINFILFCSTSKKYRAIFLHRLCRIRLSASRAV